MERLCYSLLRKLARVYDVAMKKDYNISYELRISGGVSLDDRILGHKYSHMVPVTGIIHQSSDLVKLCRPFN